MFEFKVHKITALLFLSVFPFCSLFSQFREDSFIFEEKSIEKGELNLSVNGSGFFFNQEFFNPMAYSFTLAGYSFSPVAEYQIGDDLRIKGGAYLIKSLGRDEVSEIMPVFGVTFTPWKDFSVQFGTYDGGLNHRLPEQMYSYSQALFHGNEEGIRLLYDTDKIFFDVWLDWRYLTYPKDVKAELIFGGYNIDYTFELSEKLKMSLFTQMTVYHEGGQDLAISHMVTTYMNMSGGFHAKYQLNKDLSLGNRSAFIQFYNTIPRETFPFNFGYGIFSEVQGSWKFLSVKAGYWYGNRFYNPLGEFQFGSVSQKTVNIQEKERSVFYAHFDAQKEFYPGIIMGTRVGGYLSQNIGTEDFYIGLFLKYDLDFLLIDH